MGAISRREFFATVGGAAGLTALGVACGTVEPAFGFVRPPGAVPSGEFLARCLRCGKCIAACPVNVVQPVSILASPKDARTPHLQFSSGYCDYCRSCNDGFPRCVQVCPSGALETNPQNEFAAIGVAVVDRNACVAWSWTGCAVCADACPQAAISLDERNRPCVDAAHCDGCGLCELMCPSASVRSYQGAASSKGIRIVAEGGDGHAL